MGLGHLFLWLDRRDSIGYFAVKTEDEPRANHIMKWGLIWTLVSAGVWFGAVVGITAALSTSSTNTALGTSGPSAATPISTSPTTAFTPGAIYGVTLSQLFAQYLAVDDPSSCKIASTATIREAYAVSTNAQVGGGYIKGVEVLPSDEIIPKLITVLQATKQSSSGNGALLYLVVDGASGGTVDLQMQPGFDPLTASNNTNGPYSTALDVETSKCGNAVPGPYSRIGEFQVIPG